MNRRSFLLGLGAALAAPAVVRASSLMRIAVLRETMSVKHVKAITDIMKAQNAELVPSGFVYFLAPDGFKVYNPQRDGQQALYLKTEKPLFAIQAHEPIDIRLGSVGYLDSITFTDA